MKLNNATFVTLASLLSAACGSEPESAKQEKEQTQIHLEDLKIRTEAVTKVGFTEVETGE
jgi:uncharacterized protein YcfL